MSELTLRFHPDTASPLLASGDDGARLLAAAVRRAVRVVQADGRDIAYAPLVLGDGRGCAMSARRFHGGILVEVDAPGTLLPGRGTVRGTGFPPPRRPSR
jgi:hypothetical protein